MNLQEAYAAVDTIAKQNQAVFIRVSANWYDHGAEPRRLSVEFAISLVPGFASVCDQFISTVSLQSAVGQCLAAAAEFAAGRAGVDVAAELVDEATAMLGSVPVDPFAVAIEEVLDKHFPEVK